jgi:hypothetical protein
MPTIAARQTLTSLWPILHAARSRALTDQEVGELQRLCEVLERGIPGRDAYNHEADAFSLALRSSGVFDKRPACATDSLLEKIDDLRALLEADGSAPGPQAAPGRTPPSP